jgi:ABC-2 type transport system ATP-binding protein
MKSRIALAVGAGLVAATLSYTPLTSAQAAPAATTTDGCIKSVPEPNSTEKVQICYTLFRPAGASRTHRVPFIMHSHGWAGMRETDPAQF